MSNINVRPRPADELPAPARCYFDAVARRSGDAVASCFTTDGVVIDVNRRIVGQAAIRHWAEEEVLGGVYTILDVTPSADGASILLTFVPPGESTSFRARYTLKFTGDRISLADLQYA